MPTLYELTAEMLDLEAWLEDAQGDVTGEEDKLERFFDVETLHEEKVDSYCALMRELEAQAEQRANEAKRLQELARIDKNKAERLKDRLFEALEVAGIDRMDTPRFRVTVCNNGGKLPLSMDDVDVDTLPEHFKRVRVSPDSQAIREALEAGEQLSFARLAERGKHLRIK